MANFLQMFSELANSKTNPEVITAIEGNFAKSVFNDFFSKTGLKDFLRVVVINSKGSDNFDSKRVLAMGERPFTSGEDRVSS